MYFYLLILFCHIISWSGPDQIIDVTVLTFRDVEPDEGTLFFGTNLERIASHPDAVSLELRMATCPLSHSRFPEGDRMPDAGVYEHAVVVAKNSAGEVIADANAALPCPPHCGGGKLKTTLAEFLSTYTW